MRRLALRNWFLVVMVGLSLASFLPICVNALSTPKAPTNCGLLDEAGVLNETDEQNLCKKLIDYENKTGNQLAVLTIKSLDGEDIEGYSNRVARAWGVGDKKANNGALLVVAVEDRKMRIEVGRGLEPMLTDLQANQIIKQKIRPNFQSGNFAGGINSGVDNMISVIGGERLSEPGRSWKADDLGGLIILIIQFVFVPFIYLAAFLGRSKSWWAGGVIGALPGIVIAFYHLIGGLAAVFGGVLVGLLLDYVLSKNYQQRVASGDDTTWFKSGGGFFGGSSGGSSGGWGGFGGGSFGGGGSSGSW